MSKLQSAVAKLLALQEEEYFDFTDVLKSKILGELSKLIDSDPSLGTPTVELASKRPPLLAIGAPNVIDTEQHAEFPVLIAIHSNGLRNWQVDLEQNARIVLVDLHLGIARTEVLFVRPKRMSTPQPSRSGPIPDEFNAATVGTSLNNRLGLRELLDIDWEAGRYAVTVIIYDWVSNTVVMQLEEANPKPTVFQSSQPSATLISSTANNGMPETKRPGAVLCVPENVDSNASIFIRGSMCVPLDNAPVIPAWLPLAPARVPRGYPLLMASIMFVKIDEEYPVQIDLVLPAKLVETRSTEPMIEAFFEIDARATASDRRLAGIYQVYLFAGDHVAGPYSLAVGKGKK